MPGINLANSLNCLGDPSLDTILDMTGMIRSSFPKYNSIHNKKVWCSRSWVTRSGSH